MPNLTSTAVFKANISSLKKEMQAAGRAVRAANAEFKAATAGSDDWSSSADGLEAKLKQLGTTLKAQNTQLKLQEQELRETVSAYGENSAAADRVRVAINNQKAAIAKTEAEYQRYSASLEKLNGTYGSNLTGINRYTYETERLTDAMDDQQTELDRLKAAYVGATLAGNTEDVEEYGSAIEELSGELADNRKKMQQAEAAADALDKSIEEAGDGAKEATDGFTVMKGILADIGASIVREIGQKAMEAVKYVIRVGSEFEASMSKVEALSGATGSELDALREKASELGRTTQFSASEAADALSAMALAGWSTQEMLDGIDGVLQLAAAGQMDLATASDTVAGYLAAFNMKASESTKLANIMATAQAKSKTTTDQLAAAYSTSATNLTQAGQSVETTTALIEGLASVSDTGSGAGTRLSAAMSQITQKMEEGQIAIGDTMVKVTDENGAFRDMIDIIADVEAATYGMTDAERASALQKTFNRQSMAAMNELLSVGSERLRGYKTDLVNSDGAAADMAATMTNNLNGAVAGVKSATEGLGTALYAKVKGPLTGAVKTATKLINGITDAITPQKTEVESFIEDVKTGNEEVQGLLDSAEADVKNAEAKVGELEAYKNTILELQAVLNNGGELDDFQLYQMQNAVKAVSAEVPQIGENFDAVTGRINLSTEAIETLFKATEETALNIALQKAMEKETQAYADALINQAKAKAAVKAAQEDLNEYEEKYPQVLQMSAAGTSQDTAEHIKLQKALTEASAAQAEATAQAEEAKTGIDQLKEATADLTKEQEQTAAKTDELKESGELATESEENLSDSMDGASDSAANAAMSEEELAEAEEEAAKAAEEAAKKIQEAHDNAAQAITSAYESTKQAAESAFDINPFDKWEQNSENGLSKLQESLDSQVEGFTEYSANLQTVSDHVGQEITPEFLTYLQNMGAEGAQVMQEMADALESGDTEKISSIMRAYTEAMDVQDEISSKMAANEVALSLGLGKMGSSAAEWEGLDTVVTEKLATLGESTSSELMTQFTAAEETARQMGIKIPEGLAQSIAESEDPATAIQTAIAQLEAAAQGSVEGLVQVAKESGITLPQGLQEGIKSGETDVLTAYKALLDALSTAEASSSAKEAGEASGKELTESQASGMEASAEEVNSAAESVTSGGAEAAKGKSSEYTAAGKDSGKKFADGVKGSQGQARASGMTMAKAGVTGAKAQNKAMSTTGQTLGKSFSTGLGKTAPYAKKAGNTLGTNAASGARAKQTDARSAGTTVGTQFVSGVSSKSSAATSAGRTIANAAVSGARAVDATSAGSSLGSTFVSGVSSQSGAASSAGTSLASSAQSGAKSLSLYDTGSNFGAGFVNGLRSQISAAASAAAAVARAAAAAAAANLKIGSPSKLTYQYGRWFTEGFINGIATQEKELKAAVKTITSNAIYALKQVTKYDFETVGKTAADYFSTAFAARSTYMLEKVNYQNEQNLQQIENKITEYTNAKKAEAKAIQAEYEKTKSRLQKESDSVVEKLTDKRKKEKDSDKREKLDKQIQDERDRVAERIKAQKNLADQRIAASDKRYDKLINKEKAYQENYRKASEQMLSQFRDAMGQYQEKANNLISSTIENITGKYSDAYDELADKRDNLIDKMRSAGDLFDISGAGIMTVNDINAQTKQIRDYAAKLTKIRGKVSAELFEQISSYDMDEGSAFMDRLLSMSSKELTAYNKAFTEKLNVSKTLSENLYKNDFKKLTSNYKAEIAKAFKDIPKQLEQIAKDSMKGFTDGLTKNTAYMTSGIKKIVAEMVKEFKKDLKIKSPSRVTYELGEYTGEGFGNGLRDMVRYIRDQAQGLANAASTPLDGIKGNITDITGLVGQSRQAVAQMPGTVINNYNLSQTNNSPKSLSALDTYQARRRQISMLKAATQGG
ncbi:MAG: phage tail tape measure protein [Lachnospiraceae bacterium]|nr:phage tail tape measure protein [Lachnospiraceae bacterium]